MKEILYQTEGTCAKAIHVVINDDRCIESVQFMGGCNGNTKGISSLVKGMKVEEVIERLSGTTCGYKSTSCPDQLAKALEQCLK